MKLIYNEHSSQPPPNALLLAYQQGVPYYSVIARTKWGLIPGKAHGCDAWYPYRGKEHATNDFDWIIPDNVEKIGVFIMYYRLR